VPFSPRLSSEKKSLEHRATVTREHTQAIMRRITSVGSSIVDVGAYDRGRDCEAALMFHHIFHPTDFSPASPCPVLAVPRA